MIKRPLSFAGCLLIATTVQGADFDLQNGKTLVDENCYECHKNDVYTRADRRVTSRKGLSTQVRRCELSLGLKWFDDDVEDAAEYLNRQFYHFK